MITTEWKTRLKPAEIALLCYFILPLITGWLLGGRDALGGSFTVSDILQACLGIAALRKLFGLKEHLAAELTQRLGKMGQPREKTLELTGIITSAAGYMSIAALLLPPLGRLLPDSRLITLAMFSALVYTVYMCYVVWKLSDPFLAYVPEAPEPPETPEEPPAAPVRRCPKCGQQVDDTMKTCAFCRHPLQ
ncbi:MAG: hypothetical protein COT18_03330 [Elusimicrobia bacterium CG08_land_8_20_14_0_20_59_10]|nr:MAG: hypothetical protein COT18_03330 [Elusimicrobia bacterium CG08_land_8_20_14_0_20_59_10]